MPDDQKANEAGSVKKFSKVKLLQMLGLLDKQFNLQTFEFESSLSLRFLFYLSLISKPPSTFKPLISCFFPRNSRIQLFIGSVFNGVSGQARFFFGIGASIQSFSLKLD